MMSKPIQDAGAYIRGKPYQMRRFEADNLPEPADYVDCAIIINDRSDGVPRARMAVSNGASWDRVAWIVDIPDAKAETPVLNVNDIVSRVVQSLPPPLPAPVQLIAHEPVTPDRDAVARLMQVIHDLRRRVEFLEQHSVGSVQLIGNGT